MQKGHIFRRHGAWYVRFYERDTDGGWKQICKRLAAYEYPYRSKRAVEKLAHKHLNPINSGTAKPESTQRLRDFVEGHYLPFVEKSLRTSTYKAYEDNWNCHVKDVLGSMRLRDIKPSTAQMFLDRLAADKDLAHVTLMHVRNFLSGILTHARVRHDMTDVVYGLKGIRVGGRKTKPKAPAYSLKEIQSILRVLPEPARIIVLTAALTGLSRSELMGLQWSDFTGEELHVRRTVWNSKIIEDTKTEARAASVPVISVLRTALEKHHRANRGTVWIFEGARKRHPLNIENVKLRVIQPALKKAKLEWKGWHAFRRGVATNLYDLGVKPKVIQAILRHANVETTLAFYVKPPDADSVAAMKKLEQAFGFMEQSMQQPTAQYPVSYTR